MADTIYKVRVQVLGENGEVIGDADVQTSADLVFFADGETFQQKLDSGELTGPAGAKGDKGDKGDTGSQGPQGEQGPAGATGQRGSRWSSGTAITGTSTTATVFSNSGITDALVNDMYLNTSTGNVYRCTTAGAASVAKWVYVGNIKGAKGETGAAGKDGADGEKGATGATGPAGADGEDGADGATWLFGTSAPASSAGKNGDWYLNTSNWDIYNKASGAWTKKGNIKGAVGERGPQGPQGEQGAAGADGADGEKGDKGDKGDTGTRGSTITYGTAITGTNTSGTIFSGSGITSALVNDLYINTSTYNIYRCTTAGAANVARWAYVGCIKGATGSTGAKGDKGDKGDTGATGPAGKDGDSIKVGSDYASATERKLFLKLIQ